MAVPPQCATATKSAASTLDLLWWNMADFYHYDPQNAGSDRWPSTRAAYDEKCRRVDGALEAHFRTAGTPALIALGEITKRAAEELKARLLPTYRMVSLDVSTGNPTLQIALLFAPNSADLVFNEQMPLVVEATPRGTRPMGLLDILIPGNIIRCIVCHWQARFDDEQEETRRRIATYMACYAYNFLSGDIPVDPKFAMCKRNLMLIGDLNEEPFDANLKTIHAHRHRSRSRSGIHWTDRDIKRAHLYNASWRLLGEKCAHSTTPIIGADIAGTYYWASKRTWHHLDHIIVSGGLLGAGFPCLDEANVSIIGLPEFIPDGEPMKFTLGKGKYVGLSDHLPITARLILREEK